MTVALDTVAEFAQFTTVSPVSIEYTPIGTARGITVGIDVTGTAADLGFGVTCEGVALTRIDRAVRSAGDLGHVELWHLGAGIAAGTVTIQITHSGSADPKHAFVASVTAATDTEPGVSGKLETNQTNPQIAINNGAISALRMSVIWSNLNAPADLAEISGMEATIGATQHDFGNEVAKFGRQSTASSGSFTIGYTAATGNVAMVAAAIQEVAGNTGTIAVTQADQTAAITGTVANPITGTIGVTQADQAAAFAGSLGISGTIASTQQDQTAAFTGSAMGADWDCGDWDALDWATDCAPTGVLASTQDHQTAAFAGTVANPVSGTIGATQQDQTAAFVGTTVSDGVISSIQQDQTGAFVGTVANSITGTIGVTQQNQTAVFTGTVAAPAVTGTIGVTQQDQIAAFVGQSVSTAVTGTIASTQANQTMTASGVVAMAVSGTIAVTQQNQTATFVGAVANPADTLVVSVSCTIGGPTATCTISPEMAVVGSDVVITSNFENAAGNPADPASVTAVVEAPDGTQSTPTPMSIAVGEWTTTIPTDQYGFWFFEITGQGDDVNIVCKGSFCVERSLVSV